MSTVTMDRQHDGQVQDEIIYSKSEIIF